MELQLLQVTRVRRRAASLNGHISRIMGLLLPARDVGGVSPAVAATVLVGGGRGPAGFLVIRLLMENSWVAGGVVALLKTVVAETAVVAAVVGEGARGTGDGLSQTAMASTSVLTVTAAVGLPVLGMVVSLTKVGAGAGGDRVSLVTMSRDASLSGSPRTGVVG